MKNASQNSRWPILKDTGLKSHHIVENKMTTYVTSQMPSTSPNNFIVKLSFIFFRLLNYSTT